MARVSSSNTEREKERASEGAHFGWWCVVASLVAFHQFQPAGVVGIAASAGKGRAEQASQREQGNERARQWICERTNERMNERTCESNRTLHSTTLTECCCSLSEFPLCIHSHSVVLWVILCLGLLLAQPAASVATQCGQGRRNRKREWEVVGECVCLCVGREESVCRLALATARSASWGNVFDIPLRIPRARCQPRVAAAATESSAAYPLPASGVTSLFSCLHCCCCSCLVMLL